MDNCISLRSPAFSFLRLQLTCETSMTGSRWPLSLYERPVRLQRLDNRSRYGKLSITATRADIADMVLGSLLYAILKAR